MDTAKDARILVLEDALNRLNTIVRQRKLKLHISYKELAEILGMVEKLFYEIKYSYTESKILAELEATKKITQSGLKFRDFYEQAVKSSGYNPANIKEKLVLKEVEYALRIIEGFAKRLKRFNEDSVSAVDILAVEITQIQSVEGSNKLTECRCTDGTRIWTIVTNIQGVSVGQKLACAVLPPVEMLDIVSEAMFLGSEQLPDSFELGILSSPPPSSIKQARAQVMGIIKRLK